jgi:hypothetical protein
MKAILTNKVIESIKATLASAEVSLSEARTALVCDAPSANSKALANRLSDLATHEGRVHVLRVISNMIEKGRGDFIADQLEDFLLAGADDSWSGRTNDVARARFDGIRHQVRAIRDFFNRQ